MTTTESLARNYELISGPSSNYLDSSIAIWGANLRVLNSFTPASIRSIRVVSSASTTGGVPVEANLDFYVTHTLDLWGATTLNSIAMQLRDNLGNLIGIPTVQNTLIAQYMATLQPFTRYVLSLNVNGTSTIASAIATLEAYTTNYVSDYFDGGFTNVITLSPSLTLTIDGFGQFLYTFTNYTVNFNERIKFAAAIEGKQSGVCTVTSSNTSFYASYTQNFGVQNSIDFNFQGLQTGSFTGTIALSIVGIGSTTQVNFIPTVSANLSVVERLMMAAYKRPLEEKSTTIALIPQKKSYMD